MEEVNHEDYWREFADVLLYWFDGNRRILPWRDDPTPYHVWVSEIMLQQTRVEAVKPYYDRFVAEIGDIEALAQAKEEKLLKLWEGLGYYHRVRNMQKAAQTVMLRHGGRLPEDYDTLIELQGIGSYTAGAISSIAYGHAVPAVDGNVLRVMTRILEYNGDVTKDYTKKYFFRLLSEHMPEDRPGDFNQALMELGAIVCIPNGRPLCGDCPLYGTCLARRHGTAEEYPVRPLKKPRRIVDMLVYHITDSQGRLLIRRRGQEGLLSGMWELPNEEQPDLPSGTHAAREKAKKRRPEEPAEPGAAQKLAKMNSIVPEESATGKHIFSHVEWHMTCIKIKLKEEGTRQEIEQIFGGELAWATAEELKNIYALPAAFSMWVDWR